MPGTSAMQICQLKPIGANTYCIAAPDAAGEAVVDRRQGPAHRRRREAGEEPQQHRQARG